MKKEDIIQVLTTIKDNEEPDKYEVFQLLKNNINSSDFHKIYDIIFDNEWAINTKKGAKLKPLGIKKLKELSDEIEIEKDELKKSKIDLELSERMLEEYPKTKWFARIGFIIAVILVLKELVLLIIELLSKD
ncbi:hypothetical protein ACE01N_20365 [Saccharicrinis sp. FJH2]|uniref:hypothetical protein n=1 Tax=Saccharicrinis sp. FJH65 TaxID=3344659 RepID=UPI0035F2BF83